MSLNFEDFIPYYFGLNFAFYAPVLLLKILCGMANSVEPDQTGFALFSWHFVRHFGVQNFSTFTIYEWPTV